MCVEFPVLCFPDLLSDQKQETHIEVHQEETEPQLLLRSVTLWTVESFLIARRIISLSGFFLWTSQMFKDTGDSREQQVRCFCCQDRPE